MKAVNEMKPINVLVRFITTWIKEHSADGAPFDSFEAMRAEPIEQKDVERWILNCNYTYYRLGDTLLEHDLFPADQETVQELFCFLDDHIKSIRDTNPLKLRSKQPEALVDELGKDWPPFCAKSRNDVAKVAPGLQELAQRFAKTNPELPAALQQFVSQLAEEARWYRSFERHSTCQTVAERCRVLLPVWCAQEINPLFSLLMWQDERALAELSHQLSNAFAANGYPSFDGGSQHDAYRGVVRVSQQLFLDGLAACDARDVRTLPLARVAERLETGMFSLERPAPIPGLPVWLPGKALLLWNIVICSILGPREAIRPLGANRTVTTLEPVPSSRETANHALRGEVLLRRCLAGGERELAGSIDLGEIEPKGTAPLATSQDCGEQRLWRVLGSAYDEQARIPDVLASAEPDIARCFLPTARLNDHGAQIEGRGDSRYHAVLLLRKEALSWKLELRDLGSKNGTYVLRQAHDGRALRYVLASRKLQTAEEWAAQLGTSPDLIRMVDALVLERGDIIQLCGSRFELL